MPKPKNLDEKAFKLGWDAYLRGSPMWSNPYRGPGMRFMWSSGWKESKYAKEFREKHPEKNPEKNPHE